VLELVRGRRSAADLDQVFQAVRRAVSFEHELTIRTVVLVETATLPVTTSGKIRRRQCRWMLLNGELDIVAQEHCGEDDVAQFAPLPRREDLVSMDRDRRAILVESYLAAAIARLLHRPSAVVPREATLAALGLDSLAITELANRIEADLGIAPPFDRLLDASGVADIAQNIVVCLEAALSHPSAVDARGSASGGVIPMSHGQRALWFLQSLVPVSTAHNITIGAEILGALDLCRFRRAFQQLVDRHETLRSKFPRRAGRAGLYYPSHPEAVLRPTQLLGRRKRADRGGDGRSRTACVRPRE